MEKKKEDCLCGSDEFIVMACSGASDVGLISDLVARKLNSNGVRKMNCLAVIGAGIEKSIESFRSKNLLVIDGCPVDCGKRMLDQNGFKSYKHLRVTDLGYKKGKTPVIDETIQAVYKETEIIY